MGVHFHFLGHVTLEPPLNAAEREYLAAFADSRRWDRPSGPYTVPDHPLVDDYEVEGVSRNPPSDGGWDWPGNRPPVGQPGLWCDWTACARGCCLSHNGREKFYGASAWLEYVIDHFLRPGALARTDRSGRFDEFTFDHTCSGTIATERRDTRELSLMRVVDNQVLVPGVEEPW